MISIFKWEIDGGHLKVFKLEIELIPRTTFFTNVRSLVRPQEWDVIRKKCYSKASYRCEVCGGRGEKWPVECHEIWEYNFAAKVQTLKGIIALCPDCHEVKHIGLAKIKGNLNRALAHFMKINGVDKRIALACVRRAFEERDKKNKVKWKLDTSFLKGFLNET